MVVDGVPVIDASKRDKLLARIAKDFGRKGAPVKTEDMFVPWDDAKGKSKGCALRSSSPLQTGRCVLRERVG